jgi:methylmalonyl-CoA mutase cobalamin-binding subunit
MRRRTVSEYAAFAAEHSSDGVAVATTRGAHLAKLRSLRDETPGHYWVACFPP